MQYTPSAILAVSSVDRYTTGIPNSVARTDSALINLYDGIGEPGNNFQLSSPNAFIYGYITRIAISQIQLEYKIPTIVPSNRVSPFGANDPTRPVRIGNDVLPIFWQVPGVVPDEYRLAEINLPYGFYTPEELAAMLEVQIQANVPTGLSNMRVTYANSGSGEFPTSQSGIPTQAGNIGYGNAFTFSTLDTSGNPTGQFFGFPDISGMRFFGFTENQILSALKTYRLVGITVQVCKDNVSATLIQGASPNFVYTPYIDIISTNLTKFQKVKDADTSVNGRNGLVSRLYISGVGFPVATSPTYALGSEPFVITADLNTPKLVRWNKDETVYNLDFKLFDHYGDLIYWTNENPTEFQMTLLCMEEDN
jgi:hypothetical protein